MNIACPECRSVFRVDPAKVPAGGVRARCSVCGGVITVSSELAEQGATAGGAQTTAWSGGAPQARTGDPGAAPQFGGQSGIPSIPTRGPSPVPPPAHRPATQQPPASAPISTAQSSRAAAPAASPTAAPTAPPTGLPSRTTPPGQRPPAPPRPQTLPGLPPIPPPPGGRPLAAAPPPPPPQPMRPMVRPATPPIGQPATPGAPVQRAPGFAAPAA
ncbi:MAG: zinc-ribbon domain-containing protein, partial [Gemmatimonadaceae bacterium]